jgi:hypothetical protein
MRVVFWIASVQFNNGTTGGEFVGGIRRINDHRLQMETVQAETVIQGM